MGKSVDMFQASRTLSDRVAEFMRVRVGLAILKARYDKEREEYVSALTALDKVKGGMLEDTYNESLRVIEENLENLKAEYDKAVEDASTFEYSECDKALYKSYKDGESMSDALCKWARAYDLEIAGTDFLNDLLKAVGGLRAQNGRGIIKSKGESFTKVRSRDDILKTMYGVYTEKMLKVGTLKAEQIPEDVFAIYAPKKKADK